MPSTSRLEMGAKRDLLSLAYNTFFSELEVPVPSQSSLPLRFWITGRGRPGEDLRLTLQLCLKSGETLETGAGRKMLLGKERLELSPEELGGRIRHHGWTLRVGRRGSFGPSTRTTPTQPSRKPDWIMRWGPCPCRCSPRPGPAVMFARASKRYPSCWKWAPAALSVNDGDGAACFG